MKRFFIVAILLGLAAAGCDKSDKPDEEPASATPTTPSIADKPDDEPERRSLDDAVDNELVADGMPPNLPLQWHPPPRFPKPLPRTRHIAFDDRPVKGASADDALVNIMVVCEAGCPACEEYIPNFERLVDRHPYARVAYHGYARFGHSKKAEQILVPARERGKFWDAYDILFDPDLSRPERLEAARKAVGLDDKPADSDKVDEAVQQIAERTDDAMATNTPTTYVNGVPVTGGIFWDVERLIRAQARFAEKVSEETGLRGEELYKEVARRNAVVDQKRRDARSTLESKCEAGDARRCIELGDGYFAGDFGMGGPERAAKAYAHACTSGERTGCILMTLAKGQGTGDATLIRNLEKGCKAGFSTACFEAARMLASGKDVSAEVVSNGCKELKDPRTCAMLGVAADRRAVALDTSDIGDLWRMACKNGYNKGCLYLAALAQKTNPTKVEQHAKKALHSDKSALAAKMMIEAAEDVSPQERTLAVSVYDSECRYAKSSQKLQQECALLESVLTGGSTQESDFD